MRRKIFLIFIFLLILSEIFALSESKEGKDTEKPEENEMKIKKQDHAAKYIFLSTGIIVVVLIRHASLAYGIPIPYSIFCILLSIFCGVGSIYSPEMQAVGAMAKSLVGSIDVIYVPAIIFGVGFSIDVHAFTKSLTQIVIISIPIALLNGAITGLLMRLVIDTNWTSTEALLFGVALITVYPSHVLRWLRDSSFQTKYVRILLQGETLIGASASIVLYNYLVANELAWVVQWYQFAALSAKGLGIAIPLGYLYGLLGCSLMRLAYNDSVGLMLVTVTMCYTTYIFLKYIAEAPILGTVVVSVIMGLERASLTKEMEKMIIDFWNVINIVMNGIVYINIGVLSPYVLRSGVSFTDYILVFVTYLVTNISRFMCFFLFSPILSRIGYGMSFQNMVICVWSGFKNPLCLQMAYDLYANVFSDDKNKGRIFFLHIVSVYLLLLVINGSCVPILINALGLSNTSMSKLINMNNCMRFIYEARARTMAILKMDRLLSDANWPLVMTSTTLMHPYKSKLQVMGDEDEEEEENFLGYKYTFCPDCQQDIPNEPTPKELKEMTKEAKLRILKLKNTVYSRQYENGMMSKEAIRILHRAVEMAMDSGDLVIELDGLFKLFTKEGLFYRALRNRLQFFLRAGGTDGVKPPRRPWRLHCYRIVKHTAFHLFIDAVLVIHFFYLLYHIIDHHKMARTVLSVVGTCVYFLFFFIYLTEFCLKIFALSWIYICRHGIRNYFRSYWNIFDFSVMIMTFVSSVMHAIVTISIPLPYKFYFDIILLSWLSIRLLRLFALLKMCDCCRTLTPALLKYLDAKVDKHRILAYELGKNYIAGEEEILKNLNQIVDNDQIREEIKRRVENDRMAVTRRLGLAQKESPVVAITVKTKLAMNTVLNRMLEDIKELKVSGWVDDAEYAKLLTSWGERCKFVQSFKTIQPSPPKLILREVPYMGEDDELIEFLYTNASTKKFEPGNIVINEGESPECIYILITGMFLATYNPQPKLIERLKEVGTLPILDYITSLTYEEADSEYIVSGNTIGELSFLTDRPYSGIIIAETQSQVYVLNRKILRQAFQKDKNPVNGLECRMWKYVSFRMAVTVLMNVPSYRSYTQEKIMLILERSFVPNLSNYMIFVVNNMIEDVVLIEGVAVDFNTRDTFTGPCYIPRSVQKLVFPKSSFVNIETTIETKLLIVPAKDYHEYEIMMTEEQICELVNENDSKCLLHIIQQKASVASKDSKHSSRTRGVLSGIRKRGGRIDTTKSKGRITGTASVWSSKPSRVSLS